MQFTGNTLADPPGTAQGLLDDHEADSGDPHAAAGYQTSAEVGAAITAAVSGAYAPITSRGSLDPSAYPDVTAARSVTCVAASTTSVERAGHPSQAFQGGTSTQIYSVDGVDGWHTGHTGTGASSQAGWVSASLLIYLERVKYLFMKFRYDALSMSDNHRCYHGFTTGTPAYSTPATEFDTAYAALTAIGGTDTNWQLRTRTASGAVTTVDTGVAVAQGAVYRARLRYSGGSVYAQMSANGGAWSSEVSTASTLPTSQALRVSSYARVASPSVGVELGNNSWCLVVEGGTGA